MLSFKEVSIRKSRILQIILSSLLYRAKHIFHFTSAILAYLWGKFGLVANDDCVAVGRIEKQLWDSHMT